MQYGRAGLTINLEKFFNLRHTTRIKTFQKQTYMQRRAPGLNIKTAPPKKREREEEKKQKKKKKSKKQGGTVGGNFSKQKFYIMPVLGKQDAS